MFEKFNGCLLGLAIGNALGTPVEFLIPNDIQKKYEWESLYKSVYGGRYKPRDLTLILDMQMSLADESHASGSLMWTVPVGLALTAEDAFKTGLEFAAIKYNHPSEYLPAGFIAALIAYILVGVTLRDALDLCRKQLITYAGNKESLDLVDEAIHLSYGFEKSEYVIECLGSGRSGKEALAIAIYCSLKYAYDFKQGVLAAVTHTGQIDSTGAITGAILGALLGDDALPMNWIVNLKNSYSISQVAKEMFQIFQSGQPYVYAKSSID